MENKKIRGLIRESLQKHLFELDLNTYAGFMDNTESYPWAKNVSGNYSPHGTGSKKERVNNLARQRFEEEFYKKFPKDSTTITFVAPSKNKSVIYLFHNLTWRTNYTSFDLFFSNEESSSHIFFIMEGSMSKHTRHAGILDRELIKIKEDLQSHDVRLTEESQNLLNMMVNYGTF